MKSSWQLENKTEGQEWFRNEGKGLAANQTGIVYMNPLNSRLSTRSETQSATLSPSPRAKCVRAWVTSPLFACSGILALYISFVVFMSQKMVDGMEKPNSSFHLSVSAIFSFVTMFQITALKLTSFNKPTEEGKKLQSRAFLAAIVSSSFVLMVILIIPPSCQDCHSDSTPPLDRESHGTYNNCTMAWRQEDLSEDQGCLNSFQAPVAIWSPLYQVNKNKISLQKANLWHRTLMDWVFKYIDAENIPIGKECADIIKSQACRSAFLPCTGECEPLKRNLLVGEIPKSIFGGTLEKIDLSQNANIAGTLPPLQKNYSSLRCLDIRGTGVNGFGSSGNNASVRKDYMSRVNITLLPWQPNFAAVLAFHEGCTICNATNCSSSSEEYSEIYLQCVNMKTSWEFDKFCSIERSIVI